MDLIKALFGRFHPLIVHLPIGIFFIAFLFECLSLRSKYRALRNAVQPALFWGMIFAIASVVTGLFLREEGGYDDQLVSLHQNFGIATAVFSIVVYIVRRNVKRWAKPAFSKRTARIIILSPLMVLILITGHWGGSMTHGEDYLFASIKASGRTNDPATRMRNIAVVSEAVLYEDVIQPIFEARCYDCHSSAKQKGDLRLDSREHILRGGEGGKVIDGGIADSMELFKRLVLPLEHEDHMPPNEKPQLTSSEIALIKYWLEEKADFSKRVASFQNDDKISAVIESMRKAPARSWIPEDEVSAANEKVMSSLISRGLEPMPIALGSNYLMLSFHGKKEISDPQLESLADIRKQLVWMDISHTEVKDAQLEKLAALNDLRVLYLNNTEITDAGIRHLQGLDDLRILSLVGTRITDASMDVFAKMKALETVFLFQTGVSAKAIAKLAEQKEIRIDTGNYMLEKLPTDTIVYKLEL